MEPARIVNVKVSAKDYEELEKLVEKGEFLSISDAVRSAIRLLISTKYKIQEVTTNA